MVPASRWTVPYAVVVLTVLGSLGRAQDPPPTARMTNRILFVVDVSASMRHGDLVAAAEAVLEVAGGPTDDVRMNVIWFNDHPARWGNGWAKLPDPKVMAAFRAQIPAFGNGSTDALEALRLAYAEPMRDLSIVLITDGAFTPIPPAAIEEWQVAREAAHGRANLAVICIGDLTDAAASLPANLGVFKR